MENQNNWFIVHKKNEVWERINTAKNCESRKGNICMHEERHRAACAESYCPIKSDLEIVDNGKFPI